MILPNLLVAQAAGLACRQALRLVYKATPALPILVTAALELRLLRT